MGFGFARLALACGLVIAATVAVAGGNAANRDGQPTFDAVPGPGRVTYGENIAYRATFTNTGGSNFTHVRFRMRIPYAQFGSPPYPAATPVANTCPSTPVVVSTANGPEWTCEFGNLGPGTAGIPQLVLTVVWKVPVLTSQDNCENCLKTNGRWTIKEGLNDVSDPNDAFPFGGIDRAATLLSAESETLDPTNATEAGGYELKQSCADAFGAGSLRTKPKLDTVTNAFSSTVCVPDYTIPPSLKNDLGVATTIVEGPRTTGPGHPYLGQSVVCIAALGQNCGAEGSYDPQDFGTDAPVIFVFRIADDALLKGDKITQLYHNGEALPSCATNPTNANGCAEPIIPPKGKVKVWTLVGKARTNGRWEW
jgi:hypothetical protein